jgi:hypothetical protein
MRERRLVKVAITFELLFEWLTQDNEVTGPLKTTKGLPPNAVFVASFFDDRKMEAFLMFEHDSFPIVQYGGEIPYFNIEFTRFQKESTTDVPAL